MASLQKEPTGTFHTVIRIDGQRFKRSLQTKNEQDARLRKDELQETLELINRGRISVPDDCTTLDFPLIRLDVICNFLIGIPPTDRLAATGVRQMHPSTNSPFF